MAKSKKTQTEEQVDVNEQVQAEEVQVDAVITDAPAEEVVVEEVSIEDELTKKLQEALDKELRLRAEFDNYKRRTTGEILNASDRGKIEVFKGLLETLDNLERALLHECSDETYVSGIVMVYNKLKEKLTGLGLEEINCEGIMDHNFHQAVITDSIDDLEDDQIIEVLQKGYKMNDTLIRVAMVKVNKK